MIRKAIMSVLIAVGLGAGAIVLALGIVVGIAAWMQGWPT